MCIRDRETGEVFAIDLWKILFMLINLFLIYLILKRFLYKPVKKMFEMREQEVAETYQKADAAEAEDVYKRQPAIRASTV